MQDTPEYPRTRRVLIAAAVFGLPLWVFVVVLGLKQFGVVTSSATRAVDLPPAGVELSQVPGVSLRRLLGNPAENSTGTGGPRGHFGLEGSAMNMEQIVGSVVLGRVYGEHLLPGGWYYFKIAVTSGGRAEATRRLGDVLEDSLRLRLVRAKREIDVLILTCPDVSALSMARSTLPQGQGAQNRNHDGNDWTAYFTGDMATLARFVQGKANSKCVIDETGITGIYEAHLRWTHTDRHAMERLLGSLGLKLDPGRREVEATFIEKIGEAVESTP